MSLTKLIALILILMLAVTPALAQDAEEELVVTIEITGTVDLLSADAIVVGGVTIAPAGAFIPAALSLGETVRIVGILLDDGTLQALSLEVVVEEAVEPEPEVTPEPEPEATAEPLPEATEEPVEDPALTCDLPNHPVATALAVEFELDYATVIGWHCAGYGFGDIARALLLAESQEGVAADDLLARFSAGEGWGLIVREMGVHPSQLAPGRVLSARPEHAGPPEWAGGGRPENPGNSGGNPGGGRPENPGNSGNPGGGRPDNPGNSGGNPGGGRPDNPGNSGGNPGGGGGGRGGGGRGGG